MVRVDGVSSGWPSVISPSTVASCERIPDKPFSPTSLTYCEQAERTLNACATTVGSRREEGHWRRLRFGWDTERVRSLTASISEALPLF